MPQNYTHIVPMSTSWLEVDNYLYWTIGKQSFPGGSDGKESASNAGDPGSIPMSQGSPKRRKWQPIPVFLPGEFHGQRSLEDYNPWGSQRVGQN